FPSPGAGGKCVGDAMPNLKLTLACWDYDRTRPLMDGRVKPEGIDLDIEILRPRQAFQRMLDKKEFDVSELSLASYTALKGRGECPFVAVPVALSKIFRHSCIYVRRGAVVLREDIYRAHPWAARSIYRAFVQARDLAVGGLYDADALRVALPWLIDHVEEAR